MAYALQTFSAGQILTAAQMNAVEVNIRDHIHGADSVAELSAYARLADAETITGDWVFNSLLQIPAGLKVNNTVADFDLADGRDTYIDSGESSIFVSQAGAGDFGSEAGHLIIQPRMVGGGVYRDIIFAGGNATAENLMRIPGEGKVGIGTTAPLVDLQIGDTGASINIGGTPTANGSGKLSFLNSNSTRNWKISTNDTVSSALEFTPSTMAGGSTFTIPLVIMYEG